MSLSKQYFRRNYGLIIIALLAISLLMPPLLITRVEAEGDNTVYAVICIDTENGDISWYPGHEKQNDPNPLFDTTNFKPSRTITSTIFSDSYRASHTDSYGNSFKMSWYTEMDKQFDAATYKDEGPLHPELTGKHAGYTAIMDTLLRYWAPQIQQFGDGIYFHHHVQAWTGTQWAADESVISGYTHHYDAVNHMIIDRSYYPSVYRAGWLWEDDNINDWLENLIPFDYSQSGGGWAPYHPNVNNPWSSSPPSHDRWMTRTDNGASQSSANAAFQQAQDTGKAIYSIYFHDREDMVGYVSGLQTVLNTAASSYPTVKFKYVTALDAIQSYLGYTDRTQPTLSMTKLDSQTYTIASDEPVWNNAPYIATKYVGGSTESYDHKTVVQVDTNVWQATIPEDISISPPAVEYRPPVTTEEYHPVGVTASGEHIAAGCPATNAVDNNDATYWDSAIDLPGGGHGGQVPAWIKVDYGAVKTAGKLTVLFYDSGRSYTYGVTASQDGSTWTQIVPAGTVVSGLATHTFSPAISLRYVNITVTANTANNWAHIKEIRLYAPTPSPVTASGEHTAAGGAASNAIDNNDATYWDSAIDLPGGGHSGQVPAWICVDYGAVKSAGKLSIHFYDNDPRSYTYGVKGSQDGSSWTQIVPAGTVATGFGVTTLSPAVDVRYVNITVTGNSAGDYAHIKEIRLYAQAPAPYTMHLDTVGVAASDMSGNPRVLLAPDQAASINTCDVSGAKKDTFSPSDIVYVTGTDFSANTDFDTYVVNDVSTWTEGQALVRVAGTTTSVHADSSGEITATIVWNPTLTPGKYDIVIDVNENGKYDSAFDILYTNKVQVTAGFFVIPEYVLGTILALGVCFAGVAVYRRSKHVKRKMV